MNLNKKEIKEILQNKLSRYYGTSPSEANKEQIYKSVVLAVRDILTMKKKEYNSQVRKEGKKRIYYMCMEFLIGRSLKMNLNNLGVEDIYRETLKEFGFDLDDIYEMEPDAALGNGGLGRLASCFMDALSTLDYPAYGYSLCYEYGLFRQKIADGEQIELPDEWLTYGDVWLVPRRDKSFKVKLGGRISEKWDNGRCEIIYTDYDEVEAIPYDMMISGADSDAVSTLRLWKAQGVKELNMELFSQGQYVKAVEEGTLAEAISKVLYPNDNHLEGKILRLSQQYFLVSASLQNIISDHLFYYKDLSTLPEKVAIHINDTHPALVIPELMRLLMDQYNYSWEQSWDMVTKIVSYTNHTVLPEALECWNEDLFKLKLPRIYTIIQEINERFCKEAWDKFPGKWDKISKMAIIGYKQIRMANLSVIGSHTVNGVSKLHSDILKTSVFNDFADMYPDRFTNVTNGIAHRKWLCYSNPGLCKLLDECIGTEYRKQPWLLKDFEKFADDSSVLDRLEKIKKANKESFAKYIFEKQGAVIDPDSIFDVQAKRLHEYKRQLLNALHIISIYTALKENPDLPMIPRTFIFAAKAAPGYAVAKSIIRLICYISADIQKHPEIKKKLNVIFIENYNVTVAEHLMPAAEVSEQISLAGKEASGTGNMKFMINGALTIGTLDGANVEISESVGMENIFIFGHTADEVEEIWRKGYASSYYYNRNADLKRAVDYLHTGFNGRSFEDMENYLLFSYGVADPYMCLADYEFYAEAQKRVGQVYADRKSWNKKSLMNIANAGVFAADRSIGEYAKNIWRLDAVKIKK